MTTFAIELCRRRRVFLLDIGPTAAHRKPDANLVAFYQEHGDFLHPVLLRENAATSGAPYEVLHGNRRIASARASLRGQEVDAAVTAILVPHDMELPDGLIAALDLQVELNHVVVWEAIVSHRAQNPGDIARQLGIPRATVEKYLALQRLTPELLDMFRLGKISFAVAYKLAKLPSHVQAEALALSRTRRGKITHAIIEEARTHHVVVLPDLPLFEDIITDSGDNVIVILSAEEAEAAAQAVAALEKLLGASPKALELLAELRSLYQTL